MKTVASLVIAFGIVLIAVAGLKAQVPPHNPGTICVTPQFWCWAQPPGPPGGTCFCATGGGPVQGRLT